MVLVSIGLMVDSLSEDTDVAIGAWSAHQRKRLSDLEEPHIVQECIKRRGKPPKQLHEHTECWLTIGGEKWGGGMQKMK